MSTKRTLRERIDKLTDEADALESRAAKLADRANSKRRLIEKLRADAAEALA